MEANDIFVLLFIVISCTCLSNASSFVDLKRKTVILDHTAILTCSHFCSGPVTWTSADNRPVIHCENGHCQAGKGFENRVRIPYETADWKYSLDLIFDVVKFNDQDGYVGTCDGHYCDYKLEVLVPVSVNATTGHNISLPCHAVTQEDYILWEKDGETVLLLKNGHVTYGLLLENRVSISVDNYKNGDLSLHITNVRPSDEGVYHCHYTPTRDTANFRGGPNSMRLSVHEETKPWSCAVVTVVVTLVIAFILQAIIFGLYKGIPHLVTRLKAPRVSVAEQNEEASIPPGNPKDYSTVRPTDC